MITKSLIVNIPNDLYEVTINNLPNQVFDFTIPGKGAFTIITRTYIGSAVYFTIKLGDEYLCINNLARLGVNLVYAPILTLDNEQHGFFLLSTNDSIRDVTYDILGSKIKLYYTTLPYSEIHSVQD